MKLLVIFGLVALTQAVPQRFRPRTGRQNSYLAPDPAPSSDVESSYLAPAPSDDFADIAAPVDNYGAASFSDPVAAPSDGYGAAADDAYAAPSDSYGAAASDLVYDDYDPNDIPADQAAPQPAYNNDAPPADTGDMGLKMLMNAVPGTPGVDYPIYAETPETGFTCDGQVEGGYYADQEAECQVFHICAADAEGGLSKYSFLCPNGTIFNQNYFICDWWFNFDCSLAEGLFSKNDEIAAERAALDAAAAASNADAAYSAPAPVASEAEVIAADEALSGYDAPAAYDAPRAGRQRGGVRRQG